MSSTSIRIPRTTLALVAVAAAFALPAAAAFSDSGVTGHAVMTDESLFDSAGSKSVLARCPARKKVVGTGYEIKATDALDHVVVSRVDPGYVNEHYPDAGANLLVHAREREPTDEPWAVIAHAVCADVD